MDDHFPWFTEWNGIFMPVGDALGNSCVMAIVIMILSAVGFVFYAVIKAIVEGFKAAGRKEWGKAFVFWAIPVVPVALFGLVFLSGIAKAAAQEQQRQALEEQKQTQVAQFRQQFPSLVEIDSVERVGCKYFNNDPHYICLPDDRQVYLRFTARNNSDVGVEMKLIDTPGQRVYGYDFLGGPGSNRIGPHQSFVVVVTDLSGRIDGGGSVVPRDGYSLSTQLCMMFTPYATLVSPTIVCRDISRELLAR